MLGGFVQVNFEDGAVSAFEGRFGQTAIDDRFRLRRRGSISPAILRSNSTLNGRRFWPERWHFGQPDCVFRNRHLGQLASIPCAQVKIGQYKAPFGLEQLTPDTTLFTIERTLPTGAITPDRQIGVELWGKPFTSIWPKQQIC